MEKGGKPDRKPHPLLYGLRNLYRYLKSENPQGYAQKPQGNCMFMNSAPALFMSTSPLYVSALVLQYTSIFLLLEGKQKRKEKLHTSAGIVISTNS